MFEVIKGRVYLNGVEQRWPFLEVRSNDEGWYADCYEKSSWPYKAFVVQVESGWTLYVSFCTTREYDDEGTPENPWVSVGPHEWSSVFNNTDAREAVVNNGGFENLWKKFRISSNSFQALMENVATWPAPPLAVLQAVRNVLVSEQDKRRQPHS